MKLKFIIVLIFLLFTLHTTWENLNLQKINKKSDFIPWEIIIKYKTNPHDNLTKSQNKTTKNIWNLNSELKINNLETKEILSDSLNISLIEIKDEKTVDETIEFLKSNPSIEYAEPNYIRYLFSDTKIFTSNDPRSDNQRWLDYIDRYDAYNSFSWLIQSTPVNIWIIDNWINYNHPDLANSMYNFKDSKCFVNWKEDTCEHWYDFFHHTSTPLPNLSSHGTHVAWIIGATINNWIWIIWVNPHAKIVALKVWQWDSLTASAEIQAIDFAINNGIKIINASYWAYGSWKAEREALERYEEFWWLFVTAAWNDYQKDIDNYPEYNTYPCMYNLNNIICVASVDQNWELSAFSNYWETSVDIAAPGERILSTSIEDSDYPNIIYSNNFENINDTGRNWWEYFNRWDNTFAYGFSGSINSPVWLINLSWGKNLYISFNLACLSRWVDVELMYSTWNDYSLAETIPWVYNMWYYYTIPISGDFIADNFLFKLKTKKNNIYCVIDDISIYEDPYYESDNERYTSMNWTSMATPFVAWLASLVRAIDPELSYIDVKNLILENWSWLNSLIWKTVSWKVINAKNTLIAATKRTIKPVTWLESSRTGTIKWDALPWINRYYFEVFSWDIIIKSWFIEDEISTWLNLTWNYIRAIQWLDNLWNKSDFSTGYLCSKPILTENNLIWIFSGYECSTLQWDLNYNDNCSSFYEYIWDNNTWTAFLNTSWLLTKEVFIKNWFWEESNHLNINYTWNDSLPTINIKSYTFPTTLTSASQKNIWNIISTLWVNDWNCWMSEIVAVSASCSSWSAILSSNNLIITAPSNQQWSALCKISFKDNEWNEITWNFNYTFNTTTTNNNWWWGGGGWWWGGGGWGWTVEKTKTTTTWTNNSSLESSKSINTWNNEESSTWKNDELILEKTKTLELFDDNISNDFDFSWFNNWNPSSILMNWYSVEFNNAYEFAHRAWITTTNSIQKANMNDNLTRIAMAKMLSQYAMNVLWQKPTNIVVPKFNDVTDKQNSDYNDWVTLAYQLWIMWKNMPWNKFIPNDTVTRAEFATALSRLLYWTEDWSWKYYSTHLDKLQKEGIINNVNPNLSEIRWYVMIMLMRSTKNSNQNTN